MYATVWITSRIVYHLSPPQRQRRESLAYYDSVLYQSNAAAYSAAAARLRARQMRPPSYYARYLLSSKTDDAERPEPIIACTTSFIHEFECVCTERFTPTLSSDNKSDEAGATNSTKASQTTNSNIRTDSKLISEKSTTKSDDHSAQSRDSKLKGELEKEKTLGFLQNAEVRVLTEEEEEYVRYMAHLYRLQLERTNTKRKRKS